MIRPEDLKPPAKPAKYDEQMETLETLSDQTIREANETGRWPALVRALDTRFHLTVLRDTAQKYADAGWVVYVNPMSNVVLTIDKKGASE